MIALDLMILVPLALAATVVLVERIVAGSSRWVALLSALMQLVFSVQIAASEVVRSGGAVSGGLLGRAGGFWQLAADGLSAPLLVLTAVIGCLAVAASWNVDDRRGPHLALLVLAQALVAGVFLADNVVLFYVMWESVLVPMFFLISGWGSSDARRAAMKFLVFTFSGGVVLLLGLVYLVVSAGSFSFIEIAARSGDLGSQSLAFWLVAIGLLVKLPAIGVHTWLPDAHTEAPTAGSIVLAGVLLKMGGYGLIRLGMTAAPEGFEAARPVLAALGILGIVLGAAWAFAQSDLKRLVAYSSVAHMGFVLLAVSVATPLALGAALISMVSHGLVAGALFFLVGTVYEKAHTRELSQLGGLGISAPRWSVAFVFFSLASAGLPGLSGFPGEFLAITEGFGVWGWWLGVAGLGVVLAAAYNLRAVAQTVQGESTLSVIVTDMDSRESAAMVLMALLVVVVGLSPGLVIDSAQPVFHLMLSTLTGGL